MNIPRTPSPGEECCICLERIEKEDSKIWGCENCGKRYHMNCIQDWLNTKDSNSKCPTCRENIECMNITIRTPILDNIETSDTNIEEEEINNSRCVSRRSMRCITHTIITGLTCFGFTFVLYLLSRYP
jgi:hypothetical protein